MSSALIRGTIEDRSPRNAIENFRKEETMAERKDTLTTVFAGGPSNANRELYADPEVFKKEFNKASQERDVLRNAVEKYSQKFSKKKDSQIADLFKQCPDFITLKKVLDEQEQRWMNKKKFFNGRIQAAFHRVCKTLDGHQTILSAIPQGNEYVSVFCAALNTVIQASMNHQATAEHLMQDLHIINEVVSCALDHASLCQTKEILGKYNDLYAHIFYFYHVTIEWYQSSSIDPIEFLKVYQQAIEKVWRSLDKNYNDKFANLIAAIQTKGQEIKTRAEIGFQARVSDMHSDVQAIHCGMHGLAEIIGNEGKARAEAEQSYQRQIEQLEIDKMNQRNELLSRDQSKNIINENMVALLKDFFAAVGGEEMTVTLTKGRAGVKNEQRMISHDSTRIKSHNIYDRGILISETAALHRFIVDDKSVNSMLNEPQARSLSNMMFHRLQMFVLSKRPSSLWLSGPLDNRYPSDMSNAAACIIAVLSQAEPQLIFHFCALPSVEQKGMTEEESGLVSLIYSLILQLVISLKPIFESTTNFTHERLTRLDGSMKTFPEALKLFEDLILVSSPYIICVIDGIERIDYSRGSPRCKKLLTTMQKTMNAGSNNGNDRIFKILFTTAGNSDTLTNSLQAEDIVQDNESVHSRRNMLQQTGLNAMSLTEL